MVIEYCITDFEAEYTLSPRNYAKMKQSKKHTYITKLQLDNEVHTISINVQTKL